MDTQTNKDREIQFEQLIEYCNLTIESNKKRKQVECAKQNNTSVCSKNKSKTIKRRKKNLTFNMDETCYMLPKNLPHKKDGSAIKIFKHIFSKIDGFANKISINENIHAFFFHNNNNNCFNIYVNTEYLFLHANNRKFFSNNGPNNDPNKNPFREFIDQTSVAGFKTYKGKITADNKKIIAWKSHGPITKYIPFGIPITDDELKKILLIEHK